MIKLIKIIITTHIIIVFIIFINNGAITHIISI